jgi:hypothetical protein
MFVVKQYLFLSVIKLNVSLLLEINKNKHWTNNPLENLKAYTVGTYYCD